MKRFLSVLVASMFLASAAYAADGKGEEKMDKPKAESAKTKGAKSAEGKAEAAKGKSKTDAAKSESKTKPETK